MAIHLPSTASNNWLLRAAAKLEKACYRNAGYKYRVKIKELKAENDDLIRKGEIIIPPLQAEIRRLKEELEKKNKQCAELQQQLVDYEMSSNPIYSEDVETGSEVESEQEDNTGKLQEKIGTSPEGSVAISLPVDHGREGERAREIKEFIDLKCMSPKSLLKQYPVARVQKPPSSPKKRTRSLSPPKSDSPPQSSPPCLNPQNTPVMTITYSGPGQVVKRKRRKK